MKADFIIKMRMSPIELIRPDLRSRTCRPRECVPVEPTSAGGVVREAPLPSAATGATQEQVAKVLHPDAEIGESLND